MRRFLASAWFPFVTALVLAGSTAAAYAVLEPAGADIGNQKILTAARIAGWAIGPMMGVFLVIDTGILNLLRRLVRLRKVAWLHPVVVLVCVVPWVVIAWQLTGEPRYTPVARAIIDFAARPMLWGSLIATIFAIVLSLPLLLPAKKS